MPPDNALDRLCAKCGIAFEYFDIWGRRREASDTTRIRLLKAMGIAIDAPEQAAAALAKIEEREWQEILPPVKVLLEGDAGGRLTVTLPAAQLAVALTWRLTFESGERTEATVHPGAAREEREIAGARYARCELELPALPSGYHAFNLVEAASGRLLASTQLVACPPRCFQPERLVDGGRIYGPAVQLYALRSARNWGIGDFADLRTLIEFVARQGAGIVGVNPLHALFPGRPQEASPYRPSNRTGLNVLYLAVEAIRDFDECPAAQEHVRARDFQARLKALREAELVDYAGVAAAKLEVLELLYANFRERHLHRVSARARDFREFQAGGGEVLRLHALFDALQERFSREDPAVWGWPVWPEAYRNPASEAVTAFGRDHVERVEYFEYLQWQADLQLAGLAERSRTLGLAVGLYEDLAVGVNPGGAETWIYPGVHALDASVGAPPDEFNLKGQEWGLPPWIPQRLVERAYAPFIAVLRSIMRHAGALRIDHVMGLMRLYWVPAGAGPEEGTYVSYPFSDLLGVLALESQRNRCLIIGEDLGTVPDEVRAAMGALGMLSYRPVYFERNHQGDFKPTGEYQREAVVAVSTHDLPTLRGYWLGADLEARAALGLFPSEEVRAAQVGGRAEDRRRLLAALAREQLLPLEGLTADGPVPDDMDSALARAVHAFVARTPSKILTVQLEDLLGQTEQVNLPGTTDDRYPNWRRKLPVPLEALRRDLRVEGIVEVLREARGDRVPARPQRGARDRDTDVRLSAAIIPRATYRLQFHKEFTFAMATALVPYLAALGVSHVYASPFLKARPGSAHGYDITDHNALNPEIGSAEDFERYTAALAQHRIGQLIDLVPNHMGVMQADNGWWLDVLENGPASRYSGYFDIDWEPLAEELRGKVLIPILGAPYSKALESGDLTLRLDAAAGELSIHYHEHRFPLDPREYPRVLGPALERLPEGGPARDPLRGLVAGFGCLPPRSELAPEKLAERARDKEARKRELAALCALHPEAAHAIAESVQALNGRSGVAASFDRLHELIEAQAYRLAHWRVASDDINYRRFFDINDLAALRMENPTVFEDTHRLVLALVGEGKVDALRIDHPDGLYDPSQYFERLQARGRAELARRAKDGAREGNIYIALEKILAEHERLPEHWPVHGTTGYRFMNVVNGLFVDAAAETRMDRTYAAFIGQRMNYDEVLYQSKIYTTTTLLASELNVLANTLNRIAKAGRRNRDFTLNSLRRALVEVIAAFPAYRTYATAEGVRDEDRRYIDWAIAIARKRSMIADTGVFDFIRAILSGAAAGADAAYREVAGSFIGRFQQLTAPVTAKSMEDTSFYVYNRLVSLNEVGGDPRTFGFSLNAFHAASQDRARTWPHTMLATSTHDNKRSEDARTRIDVLSEMPAAWRLALRRWSRVNRRKKSTVAGEPAPSANDEYLLYQSLLGAWPAGPLDQAGLDAFRERIQRYMLKAVREAKTHTSWVNPNEEYERALAGFIDGLLRVLEPNPFLGDFLPAQKRIARHGMLNSLSQVLIKFVSPGVPDLYQGNELWDFSLVDPDNRRPVDYGRRAALLHELAAGFSAGESAQPDALRGLLDTMDDGRVKLYVTWKALALRARHPDVFEEAGYVPLSATGDRSEHVCTFARIHGGVTVVPIAPRLYYGLTGGSDALPLGPAIWGDTRIALPDTATDYRDELTGTRYSAEHIDGQLTLRLADVLANFPVALLVSVRDQ